VRWGLEAELLSSPQSGFPVLAGEALNRLHRHRHQAGVGAGQLRKRGLSQIDDAPVADQLAGWASVGDGDIDVAVRAFKADAHASAERVKPGSGGQFAGVKPLAVGHELAAVAFAIPGGESGLGRSTGKPGDGYDQE
jgi:hypothetical protein